MTLATAIIRLRFIFKYANFLTFTMSQNFCFYTSSFKRRTSFYSSISYDSYYFINSNNSSSFNFDFFYHQNIICLNSVLFSTCFNNCVHQLHLPYYSCTRQNAVLSADKLRPVLSGLGHSRLKPTKQNYIRLFSKFQLFSL